MLYTLPNGTAINLKEVEDIEMRPGEPAELNVGFLGRLRSLVIDTKNDRIVIADGDLDAIRDDLVERVNKAKVYPFCTPEAFEPISGLTRALDAIAVALHRVADANIKKS